jgi:V-type H+-transporting ATPase subunit A
MMNNIVAFHRLATAAVERTAERAQGGGGGGASGAPRLTLNVIKQRMGDTLYKLTSQKFVEPGSAPEEELRAQMRAVHDELVERFRALEEEFR